MPGAKRRRNVITKLGKDDQDRVNGLVDRALEDGYDPVGETVYAELDDLAKHGSDGAWALGAMKVLTIERLDAWGKDRARQQGSLVNLGDTQAFLSDTRSHRVRIYTTDGIAYAWQHEFWWQVPWDVLDQMIVIVASQGDVLREKEAAMRRGRALQDDYPESVSVEDACDVMGMTVEEFLASSPS